MHVELLNNWRQYLSAFRTLFYYQSSNKNLLSLSHFFDLVLYFIYPRLTTGEGGTGRTVCSTGQPSWTTLKYCAFFSTADTTLMIVLTTLRLSKEFIRRKVQGKIFLQSPKYGFGIRGGRWHCTCSCCTRRQPKMFYNNYEVGYASSHPAHVT